MGWGTNMNGRECSLVFPFKYPPPPYSCHRSRGIGIFVFCNNPQASPSFSYGSPSWGTATLFPRQNLFSKTGTIVTRGKLSATSPYYMYVPTECPLVCNGKRCTIFPGGIPYMGYIGMCGPEGYGFSGVLVINWVSILAILPPFWS